MPHIRLGNAAPIQVRPPAVPTDYSGHSHQDLAALHQERYGVNPAYDPMSEDKETVAARLNVGETERVTPEGAGEYTDVSFPEDWSEQNMLFALTAENGVWSKHSDDHPAWIECSDPLLAELIVRHWSRTYEHTIEVRAPGTTPAFVAPVTEGEPDGEN